MQDSRKQFSSLQYLGGLVALGVLAVVLLPTAAGAQAPAVTTTVASISGTYVMQITQPVTRDWTGTKSCSVGNKKFTFTGGGSILMNDLVVGSATFDGKGRFSFSGLQMPNFEQSASNATVSITCPTNVNGTPTTSNGHAVYGAPAPQQFSGTYTVKSDGTATVNMGNGAEMIFILAASNSKGVATFLALYMNTHDQSSADGSGDTMGGYAVLKP
jgi:hypothetical protein